MCHQVNFYLEGGRWLDSRVLNTEGKAEYVGLLKVP